jgi:hypothetical protein
MATIVTKNSSTASAVPTTSDLVQGELAVNVTDKRIFTENASTEIVELGTNPSTVTTGTATVTGTLTANGTFASNNAVITGGSVNSTPIGATTASTVRGTTVTATTGFVGGLTGNVVGNLTGNVTGNVTGNLTGNVTGNVTASSGTTTLNDLVVNGTADFTNTKLTNITTPTASSDAANKGYVDATVAAVIDSAPAALDTLNELAAALGDDANFSATVTTALATKLPLAGGTMSGAIAMGTSKITGLGDPTASQDAATKTYVDTADALKLNLSGGTMSGAIAMGTNKITGVGDPTLAQDAATKAYTDSILGSATSAADSAAAAATSASNAATSASNAASSATASASSASASASSAAAAASTYDDFDDRYLGDKASDPTLDNDGNALLTGALYFNTASDVMKVYDGSAWNIAAISSASPTFTGTVTADGLSLGDNDKATFGNSNDLEIYHDGSNSYIAENGTGNLILKGTNLTIESSTGENYFVAFANADTRLYYDNAQKFATTSTGIDVTGTATMDGLTVGSPVFSAGVIRAKQDSDATRNRGILLEAQANDSVLAIGYNNGKFSLSPTYTSSGSFEPLSVFTSNLERFSVDPNGDISFYEDTGTTPKFFWDASTERLGIGNSSPVMPLDVMANSGGNALSLRTRAGDDYSFFTFRSNNGTEDLGGFATHRTAASTSNLLFYTNNGVSAAERMRITSSGNVGIGTSSPTERLTLNGTADYKLSLKHPSDGSYAALGAISNNFLIYNNGSERLRIDSSGNLLVGTTDTNPTTGTSEGIVLDAGGVIFASNTSDAAIALNRTSSDGNIAIFKKDGTSVGSIGSDAGVTIYMDGGGARAGIYMSGSGVLPRYNGALADNSTDLGVSNRRFKDLYLSGGVYLGGTGAANKLDDYEEGTYTADLYEVGGSTLDSVTGYYIKIGNVVTINVTSFGGTTGTSGVVRSDLPFTCAYYASNTLAYSVSNGGMVACFAVNGGTYLQFVDTVGSISAGDTMIGSDISASSRAYLTFTYITS